MRRITEIIPDSIPEWAKEAIVDGQFFCIAVARAQAVEELTNERNALQIEVKKLQKALPIANQALLEMDHAYNYGSEWYTRGESGLRQQVRMWLDRGMKAITEASNSGE